MNTKLIAEAVFLQDLITRKFPTGIVSVVCDSFDFWAVLTDVLPALKDVIMARESSAVAPGKLVIRPDCYSEDTSILTPDGWKQFCELKEDDLVAQVTDSGEYEFVKPLKIVNQEYIGKMHHFKDHHGKVDLLVTPNHRMVLEQKGKERIVYAEKLKMRGNSEQKMFRSAKATGQTTKLTDLERLKIAFQADGSFATKQDTCIRFSFSKARKITRMRELLTRAGYSYNEYNLSDGKVEFNIKLAASNFQKDFDWVVFDQLDSNWACEFIDELSHWDSSVRNEGRFKFDTTTESVINKVELIAIAAGKGVLISETEDNRKEHFSKVYTAHIMDNNSVGGQSWTNEVVDYSGRVYCVTVPSGKVLVKRNRCTMVSGNSGDPVKVVCGLGYVEEVVSLDRWEVLNAVEGNDADVVKHGDKFYILDVTRRDFDDYIDEFKLVEVSEAEVKGAIEVLWETFGGTITDKGYKLLDSHIGLIYGDSITTKRAEEILRRLAEKGFASGNVVFGVGSYCVTPDTPILCDDFVWRKAGELKVGQGIIAFDENPTYGQGRKPSRRYVRGEITVNNQEAKKCVEIQCGERKLKCSYDHPVMVWGSLQGRDDFYTNKPDAETIKALNMPRGKGLIWKKAGELVAGDLVAYFGDPWGSEDDSRSTGWLEGMYDGEGSLYTGQSGRSIAAWKVSISQNQGKVYDRIHQELKERKFTTYETERKCPHIVLTGGFYEHARFLGTVRPQRLLDKASESMGDLPALKQNYTYELLEVTGVVDIGMQGISSITTSVGTFITGGFLTHNTYQCNTRDTCGFAVKATYTEVNGEGIAIFKDPKTDSKKKSAKGLLCVHRTDDGEFVLQDNVSSEIESSELNWLQTIFENGEFVKRTSLEEIRSRLA